MLFTAISMFDKHPTFNNSTMCKCLPSLSSAIVYRLLFVVWLSLFICFASSVFCYCLKVVVCGWLSLFICLPSLSSAIAYRLLFVVGCLCLYVLPPLSSSIA